MDDLDLHSDVVTGLVGRGSAALSTVADGDLVQARGWFVSDNGAYFLCPPQPGDLIRPGQNRRVAGREAVRLILQEGHHKAPLDGAWVCASGVWVERQITVSVIGSEPIDLALIAPPKNGNAISPRVDHQIAKSARRTFADRYRRWDLLALGRGRMDGGGPALYVAGTRLLEEIQDYLDTLPTGVVEFRSWLEPMEALQGRGTRLSG